MAENTPAMEQPASKPLVWWRQRRIWVAVAIGVLFAVTFLFPWLMEFRHLGGTGDTFREIGKGLKFPLSRYVLDERCSKNTVKIGIAFYTAALLIAGWLVAKKRWQIQWAINGLLALLLLAAFHAESYRDTRELLQGKFIQAWNVYHYYFGSKYFDEMDRKLQYAYTLKADEETTHFLDQVTMVNDLYEYKVRPRAESMKYIEGRNDFSPERWEEFKADLVFFEPFQSFSQWQKMLTDHGYNGTPFWNTIGSFLANHFPLQNYWSRLFVLGLDQIMLLITFIVVAIVFGPRWGIVSAIFFLIITLNDNYTVAGFIRYDWYCATVISFCLFHRGRYLAAAPFLAYAAMTRIFPIFLLAGPGLLWVVDWIKTRKMDRKLLAMFLFFGAWCLLFFYMGTWNRRGFSAWTDFYTDIRFHTAKHYLGPKRIGLKHMFIDDLSTPRIAQGDPRGKSFEKQKALYRFSQFALLALFLAAVMRRNRDDAFLLSYMFIFTILVLSRYYWALIGMLFLLSATDRSRWRLILIDIFLLSLSPIYYTFVAQESKDAYAYFMPITFLFFGLFIFLAGSYIIEDLPAWRETFVALRTKLQRKPKGDDVAGGGGQPTAPAQA